MIKNKTLLSTLIFFLLFTLTGCLSLAEDVTPPPGMSAPSFQSSGQLNPTPRVEEIIYPPETPDPNQGAAIYMEKCLPCHGENGMGDGPDAAVLENSVPALGSIALAQDASPVDWYTMVTRGNLQGFMPPFASLSNQERWDVVAYLYTFSAPPDVVELGKTLFIENCAECHGEDGQQGVVDLTAQAFMGSRTAQDLLTIISSGHELMPAFEALNSSQLWAIASHLRLSTFVPYQEQVETDLAQEETPYSDTNNASETDPELDLSGEESEAIPGYGIVEVSVVNASGETLPSNMEIVLRGYDEMTESYTQTLPVQDGDFVSFTDVPMDPGRMYFATIEHDNAAYGSNVVTLEEDVSSLSLEIPYYPPTTNLSILNVDRMHIFIDMVDEQTLEIFQLYIFSNPSDQVLVPEEADGTVVRFNVPPNATNLYVEDNMRLAYRKTDDGFGITNIYPDPDPYQAVFSYQIPYDGKKLDLTIPVGMDASALIVLAPANGFKVRSDQLQEAGTRQFEGVSYNMFTGSSLNTANPLLLNLSGRPKGNTNLITSTESSNINLVIGLGGFGIALIAAGLFLWRRNQVEEQDWIDEQEFEEEPEVETAEDLMDAIIALDDQYRSVGLPEEAYHQRRADLKERLRSVVESS